MSTKHGKIGSHKFHGAPERFEVVADYIYEKFGKSVTYIADVAGGQGMLAKFLNKKYNYKAEVVDPRGWTLKGVSSRAEEYSSKMADYYDLIVGLHPDEATREVVESATIRPVLIIPCCNFWDRSQKLGRDALIEEISKFYRNNNVTYEKVVLPFNSVKNIGLVSFPTK